MATVDGKAWDFPNVDVDSRRTWEIIGSQLGRLVEGQDRLSRVLAAILEQHNNVMDLLLVELRMGKIRESQWEKRARELAELAGVTLVEEDVQ